MNSKELNETLDALEPQHSELVSVLRAFDARLVVLEPKPVEAKTPPK